MPKKIENQDICHDTTFVNFEDVYKHCYNLLEHGEKKRLHLSVAELTNPRIADSTVRTYCTQLNRIPEKSKLWYKKNIVANLIFELEKKSAFYHQAAEELHKKFKLNIENK